MRARLIACRVMIDEIRRFLPSEVEAEVFEISQHVRPKYFCSLTIRYKLRHGTRGEF